MDEENNKKKDKKPQFNSGLAFLERIHKLLMAIHSLFFEKDLRGVHSLMTCLQIEILPRTNQEQKDRLSKVSFRLHSDSSLTNSFRRLQDKEILENKFHNDLLDWFVELNTILHELGLMMGDEVSETRGARR